MQQTKDTMKNAAMTRTTARSFLTRTAGATLAALLVTISASAAYAARPPALTISNDPLPAELQNKIYSKPSRAPETTADQITSGLDDNQTETAVGHKVDELRNELFSLQGKVAQLSERLAGEESGAQRKAAEYYANVATINTQLQSGTTPGNPRLVGKLDVARGDLENLSGSVATMNSMAMDISNAASHATFLLQSSQAAFSLSGAVEEDHVRLAQLEDAVNGTVVVIDRLLNNVNDDITRTAAYVGTERNNLRTLSLAVQTGDLFGKSLSNRPFASANLASFSSDSNNNGSNGMMPPPAAGAMPVAPVNSAPLASNGALPGGPRPLVKIRFDRPDVAYEQPVYMAVNEALQRYPNARFELVAVHPTAGNAAEVAIESTRARRDAEKVLRSLTQMGLSLDRIDLSYMPNSDATSDEVHLYVR